jgi:hypothetical protein
MAPPSPASLMLTCLAHQAETPAVKRRRPEDQEARLVGRWLVDPEDLVASKEYGQSIMEFEAEGSLRYISREADKDSIMLPAGQPRIKKPRAVTGSHRYSQVLTSTRRRGGRSRTAAQLAILRRRWLETAVPPHWRRAT